MNVQNTQEQIEIKRTEKGGIQKSKFTKGNRDKAQAEQNARLYIYNYPLHIRNGNHTSKIQN